MLDFYLRYRRQRVLAKLTKHSRATVSQRFKKLVVLLIAVVTLHSLLITQFEGLAFSDALWLTLTTMTTVGYGDISASTGWGQLTTVVLIYFLGIWMLAQLAGEYIDYRADRKERIVKGLWSWRKMRDHIVIVNAPNRHSEVYLNRLVTQMRATPKLTDLPIVLASAQFSEGLPKSLSDLGVVFKSANTSLGEFFGDVNIDQARYIIFLSQDDSDARSDSITLDLLDQFKRSSANKIVVAEAIQDNNVERFRQRGADSVLRPVRAYPELIVRALDAPGTERILEDLFGYFGATIQRYDIAIDGAKWQSIAATIMKHGLGTALGYIDQNGEVENCPPNDALVKASAILIMNREESIPSLSAIEEAIAAVHRTHVSTPKEASVC